MNMHHSSHEDKTVSERLSNFLITYRLLFLGLLGALFIGGCAYGIISTVVQNMRSTDLSSISDILYRLSQAEEADYDSARETALTELAPYMSKGAVVGVRANMAAADIYFAQSRWQEACDAWLAAARKDSRAYTAPLAWYNAAVCYEELGNTEEALRYYRSAADFKGFTLVSHALFSAARVKDESGDYEGAAAIYQELNDSYPSDSWASLAKSRLIALQAEGKLVQQ